MVEAAGIEPASQGVSTGASTCVGGLLSLAPAISDRQDIAGASPVVSRREPTGRGARSHPAYCVLEPPQERARGRDAFFRRPERSCCSQLQLFPGFTRPPGTSARHSGLDDPVETLSPPSEHARTRWAALDATVVASAGRIARGAVSRGARDAAGSRDPPPASSRPRAGPRASCPCRPRSPPSRGRPR